MLISARMLSVFSWPLKPPFSSFATYPMAGMVFSPVRDRDLFPSTPTQLGQASGAVRTGTAAAKRRTKAAAIVGARGAASAAGKNGGERWLSASPPGHRSRHSKTEFRSIREEE